MLINSQGFEHFLQRINNQDYFYETSRMLLVLDGCSGAKYSEVGTRLFTQLFSRKEENDSVEKFESNVKEVFDELIEMMRKYYPDSQTLENEFIMENLLFTIIACFECEDKFVVKMFGDGYIITQNKRNHLSYMKFSYGKCPPYFAYKYCEHLTPNTFKDYEFKTYEFDKKSFKSVGIASDGILPIVKGTNLMDQYIIKRDSVGLQVAIRMQNQSFADDVTIAIFEDKNPKKPMIFDEKRKKFSELDQSLAEYERDLEEERALEKALFGDEIVRKVSISEPLTGKSDVKPAAKSVDTKVANPSTTNTEKPAAKTVDTKTVNPATTHIEKPVAKSVETKAANSATTHIEKPAAKSADTKASNSVKTQVEKSINPQSNSSIKPKSNTANSLSKTSGNTVKSTSKSSKGEKA